MTKTVNIETARNAYVSAATKDALTLTDYSYAIAKTIGGNWATVAKGKVSLMDNDEKVIHAAVGEERAAFYVAFEASYKGAGKVKDIARVYWNRVLNHSLPKADKGAGATNEREYSARVRDETAKLIKSYYRADPNKNDLPDNADDINKALEAAFILAGGNIVQLKESMKA
jgi:hypothetical protein